MWLPMASIKERKKESKQWEEYRNAREGLDGQFVQILPYQVITPQSTQMI